MMHDLLTDGTDPDRAIGTFENCHAGFIAEIAVTVRQEGPVIGVNPGSIGEFRRAVVPSMPGPRGFRRSGAAAARCWRRAG